MRKILSVLVVLFVLGCMNGQKVCNKPYILVGDACCLDQNDNSICDKDEVTTTITPSKTPTTTTISEVEARLPAIDKELGVSLHDIHADLKNFDNEFKPTVIFSQVAITDSMVSEMGKYINEVRDDSKKFEKNKDIIPTDFSPLTADGKQALESSKGKIKEYSAEKPTVDSCLKSMETYTKFVKLGGENTVTLAEFSTTMQMVGAQIDSQDYSDAISNIDASIRIVDRLKANSKERNNLGILSFNETIISSWDLFKVALMDLRGAVGALQQGRETDATNQMSLFKKDYSAAMKAGQGENLQASLNTISTWYSQNIGKCMRLYEKY